MTEPAAAQVLLVVELTTRPGAQREMREALDRLVDATRPERGVVRFEVGFDPDDDTRVLGYEIWASQDALDEHKAKAHTREFLARARELVVDPSVPLRTGRWRPMREELPAAYVPGTPAFAPPAAPPPGFNSERRRVNDVRMHYVIGGSGTPVVLLHGFPNTWYAWRDVMPRLPSGTPSSPWTSADSGTPIRGRSPTMSPLVPTMCTGLSPSLALARCCSPDRTGAGRPRSRSRQPIQTRYAALP